MGVCVVRGMAKSNDLSMLRLSDLERAPGCMRCPAITTATFYDGDSKGAAAFLRQRVTQIVAANPWLSGNLVTGGPENKDSWGKVVVEFSAEAPADCFHEAAEIPAKSAESLGDYASWSSEFTVHNLQVGEACIDEELPLFRVTLIPIAQSGSRPQFALVVAMNHVIGDGHTFYHIHNMISETATVGAMETARSEHLWGDEATAAIFGSAEKQVLGAPETLVGFTKHLAEDRLPMVHLEIRADETMDRRKKEMAKEAGVPFVSSNDVLTSAIMRAAGMSLSWMAINGRGRQQDLHNNLAGNYEDNLMYRPADYQSPALIRASLKSKSKNRLALRRAAEPATEMPPPAADLEGGETCFVSNWAGFAAEVHIPAAVHIVHVPLTDPSSQMPLAEFGVIYAPGDNRLGIVTQLRADGVFEARLSEELGALVMGNKKVEEPFTFKRANSFQEFIEAAPTLLRAGSFLELVEAAPAANGIATPVGRLACVMAATAAIIWKVKK